MPVPLRLSILTLRVPFFGDQLAMPAQDRVGRNQGGNLLECLAAQHLASDGESPTLVIVEHDAFLAELFLQDLVFGSQVVDHGLLPVVDPAGQNGEEELPRLQDKVHAPILPVDSGRKSTGSVVYSGLSSG